MSIICGDLPIAQQLDKRFARFMYKSLNSYNNIVKLSSRLALNGSNSALCNSINTMCDKYKIHKEHISSYKLGSIMKLIEKKVDYNLQDLQIGHAIKDCIDYTNSVNDDCDISTIIHFLCVE